MDAFARRRQRLARSVRDAGLDVLLVNSVVNVSYLTGFTGDSSWLIMGSKRCLLVSDGRYTEQIKNECPGLAVHIRKTEQTVIQALGEVLPKLGVRNVGVEAAHLSLAEFEALKDAAPALSWSPQKKLVENLRLIKEPDEVRQIREAIHFAERAYDMFRALLRPGDTEKELTDAMEGYVRRAGARCSSFPPIVAIGDNSAQPHAPITARRVDESPFLLLDWGASGEFYKSDITRALVTGEAAGGRGREKVESRLEKLYTVVLTAQQRALSAVRPGVKAGDIDAAVRAYLKDEGYNEYFNHGLGHGIGLQVHEGPNIRANSPDVIEAGMVFTLEPGVYLTGFAGVRIEDDVLVTPDGCEVLTRLPKDPAAVFRPASV
ncbi:MAG: M24 family metallopeptidase [Gemmataceae bacterium]